MIVHPVRVVYTIYSFTKAGALDLESVLGHAVLVLDDEVDAVFLGVFGVGEEHALIAGGLFVGADAARLSHMKVSISAHINRGFEPFHPILHRSGPASPPIRHWTLKRKSYCVPSASCHQGRVCCPKAPSR